VAAAGVSLLASAAALSSTAGSDIGNTAGCEQGPASPKSPAFDVYGQPRLPPVGQQQQEALLGLNDKFLQVTSASSVLVNMGH
jgi:hypothetical protein